MIANVSAHRRANAFAQALEEQSDQGTAAEQPEEPGRTAQAAAAHRPRARAAVGPRDRPRRAAEAGAGPRGQDRAASPARRRDGGHAAGRHACRRRGADLRCPSSAPGQGRPPGDRTGEAATPFPAGRRVSPRAGSPSAWPPEPSAVSPPPAPTPCPATRSTASSAAWRTSSSTLADGDADRGEVYLDQASTRLSEARRLMERGRSRPARPRVPRRGPPRPVRHAARRLGGPPPAARGVPNGTAPWAPSRPWTPSPARTARPGARCATGCPSSSATSATRSRRSSTP